MTEPILILAAPRSYSSVFGAMLGQHPQTYGLPELNLFLGDTLGESWSGLADVFPTGHSGLLRTLCEITEGEQTADGVERARGWVKRRFHWPVKKGFAFIQEAVGEDKLLVEKGPTVTFGSKHIERMYRMYPEAHYLHLVRHPRSSGRSVMKLHTRDGGPARNILDPERIWRLCNSNAVAFCDTLPIGQWMRIKGEWVMSDPHLYLPQICEWLGLDAGPEAIEAMLHPEASPYACLGPKGAPFGNDPNFLEDPVLDWDRLARINEPSMEGDIDWRPGEAFTAQTVKLARQFGYH